MRIFVDEYRLHPVPRKPGQKALWQCRVNGFSTVGAGSRPELAIRDWKIQRKLQNA